jgi:hypothetical protein
VSPARVCPGAVCACRAALFDDLIRLALVASHDVDLVTFHLICSGGRRLLDDNAVASLTRHLMHVILVQIELLGNLSIRAVETHEIQT